MTQTDFDALPLIPAPASGRLLPGTFALGRDTLVTAPAALTAARDTLRALLAELPADPAATGTITLGLDATLVGDETHRLHITPAGITLRGATPTAILRGLQTLRQLIASAPLALPCVEIEDRPAFAWRGVMLDVARHFFTVPEVKAFLDKIARLKFNVFHWHLTDDQGWRIEIKSRPELTRHGSIRAESPLREDRKRGDGTPYGPFFYTQDEIREVVAHATALGVTVVPEIDLPGHVMAVLACYPELGCTGGPYEVRRTWGIEKDVLCIGNPASLDFARDVLGEVVALFPGPFVHIGGDEVPRDRWQECPICQAAIREHGLADEVALQGRFMREIETFLATHGKRPIGWDELLEVKPGARTVIASWQGIEAGQEAAAAGHDVIMCPLTHCYLDYRMTDAPGQHVGATHGKTIPLEKCYGFDPLAAPLQPEHHPRILGLQGNLWTECVWTVADLDSLLFPRAQALAEVAWTPSARRDFASFTRRLGHR